MPHKQWQRGKEEARGRECHAQVHHQMKAAAALKSIAEPCQEGMVDVREDVALRPHALAPAFVAFLPSLLLEHLHRVQPITVAFAHRLLFGVVPLFNEEHLTLSAPPEHLHRAGADATERGHSM